MSPKNFGATSSCWPCIQHEPVRGTPDCQYHRPVLENDRWVGCFGWWSLHVFGNVMYFDGNDHLGRNLFGFFDGNFFVDQTTCAPRHRPINHQGHTPPSLMIDAWVAAKQELQKFLVERRGCRWFLPRFGEKWDDLLLDRNPNRSICWRKDRACFDEWPEPMSRTNWYGNQNYRPATNVEPDQFEVQ